MKKQLYTQQMQYVQQSGEEPMNIKKASLSSTNYEMLRMVLEANLNLMELAGESLNKEKELITYSILKGIMKFGKIMEKSYIIAES